jgi:hypothetical protein
MSKALFIAGSGPTVFAGHRELFGIVAISASMDATLFFFGGFLLTSFK